MTGGVQFEKTVQAMLEGSGWGPIELTSLSRERHQWLSRRRFYEPIANQLPKEIRVRKSEIEFGRLLVGRRVPRQSHQHIGKAKRSLELLPNDNRRTRCQKHRVRRWMPN